MAEPEKKKKKNKLAAVLAGQSKKKLLVVGVLVALVIGAGLYLTVFKKAGPPPAPVAGAVLLLEPVHVNLADGRYLKLTMALQLTADAGAKVDGSKALDVAVTDLSLRRVSEMDTTAQRAGIKTELTTAIKKKYDKAVMDVYVIEFITQ